MLFQTSISLNTTQIPPKDTPTHLQTTQDANKYRQTPTGPSKSRQCLVLKISVWCLWIYLKGILVVWCLWMSDVYRCAWELSTCKLEPKHKDKIFPCSVLEHQHILWQCLLICFLKITDLCQFFGPVRGKFYISLLDHPSFKLLSPDNLHHQTTFCMICSSVYGAPHCNQTNQSIIALHAQNCHNIHWAVQIIWKENAISRHLSRFPADCVVNKLENQDEDAPDLRNQTKFLSVTLWFSVKAFKAS